MKREREVEGYGRYLKKEALEWQKIHAAPIWFWSLKRITPSRDLTWMTT